MESPFADERPLIPVEQITDSLTVIESASVAAQMRVLEEQKGRLLSSALPMVERKDSAGVTGLEWNSAIALQTPIYSVWANGYSLGGTHLQQAVRAAIPRRERSQFSGVPEKVERYAIAPDVAALLSQFLDLDPGQLIASAARAAVLNRAIQLSRNFSSDQITTLKGHLMAAILPQSDTGNPISRDDLLKRIEEAISAGAVRAENIARTELTNAYNRGRVAMGLRSELVEAFRLVPIEDTRTTEICRSRAGLIIPVTDTALLNANTPALHYRCRTTLSPVLPRVNRIHSGWMNDPERRAENRVLVPLAAGWR